MASAPSDPKAVLGRLDKDGRLIAADAELEALQRQAGSAMGQALALPQVAAVAQLARELGTAVSRPAIAGSDEHDIELWVRASPEGEEVALTLEGWTIRAPAGPRLASILGGGSEAATGDARNEWATDEQLRVISLSADLCELLGIQPGEAAGMPLTRVLRLEEDESGEMPLIAALAARRSFTGQRASGRSGAGRVILLSGDVVTAADKSFAGFRGTATSEGSATAPRPAALDHTLDEMLSSPLDRIIASAQRICDRADGPLRSDYASYGNDIAAAARHLLSVLHAMREDPTQGQQSIDLAALAAEAVVMLESSAEDRGVSIKLDQIEALPASGQERAVIQILVNLMVNAIRYSPEGGGVRVSFTRTNGSASVTVHDEGPGIAAGDEQRIFERFERAQSNGVGSGLGLAISRRLARSMGGDVTLDSAPGEGARFTLTLPSA
jgi:signal transduction histidine kinase